MPRTRNGKPEGSPKKKPTRARRTPTKAPVRPREQKPSEKRLSMVERVRLAERIVAARNKAKPDTWPAISKREGIPERTLRDVHTKYLADMARLGDTTGVEILSETLMLYTSMVERLSWEAEHAERAAERVGANRVLSEVLRVRIELLSVMGRMPRSFRAMDELAALQRLVRQVAEAVERHNFPPEVVQEFLALADSVQPVIEGRVAELPRAS